MTELTSSQIDRLEKAMESIMIVKTVILGSNGDPGLVGKVTDACTDIKELDKTIETLDTRVTKIEVRSGFIAFLVSAAAGIGSWFANKGG
jgi:precorrin-3B methylase